MDKDELNDYVEDLLAGLQNSGSKPSTKLGKNDAEVNVDEKDEFYDKSRWLTSTMLLKQMVWLTHRLFRKNWLKLIRLQISGI